MRRGTRVGEAYVAITADGSGINADIVDAVDEAGPGVEKAGEDHGERYGDSFSEGFFSRMRSKFADKFNSRMGETGRQGGEDAGSNFTKGLLAKVDNSALDHIGDRLGKRFADHINDSLGDRMEESFAKLADDMDAALSKAVNERGSSVSGNRAGPTPGDQGVDWGGLIGRGFGAGSRNNFLNLIGKTIGNVVKLVEMGSKAVIGFGQDFAGGMAAAGEGASLFTKLTSGASSALGGVLSSALASGPALAVFAAIIIGVVVPALSLFVSLAGALVGVLAALSATIVSGLVGALAVGGAAMGAAAAAAGLLVIAFTSMTDAQKKMLSEAFQPLKAEITGLGQIMLRDMVPAFSVWSQNLQRALTLALPVAQAMGTAFARAGTIITGALSGPGFQRLSVTLGQWLPSIITHLSSALGGFLNGAAGLFSSLLPYVNRFAQYLETVGDRFSKWANSSKGQNSIVDFVDRALDSLQSLWDFVGEVGGLLGDVLFSPSGQGAGNSMFDDLARAIHKLRENIDDGDLEDWFKDAKRLAKSLGDAVTGLADIFNALYDSGVITFAAGQISLFGTAMEKIADPIEWTIGKLTDLAHAMGLVAEQQPFLQDVINNNAILSGTLAPGDPDLVQGPVYDPAYVAEQLAHLQDLGNNALNQTSTDSGGYLTNEWQNPYVQWANSLMDDGPGVIAQMKATVRELNKTIANTLRELAHADSAQAVKDSIGALRDSLTTTAEGLVSNAQSALNSAASSLANANTQAEANRALNAVHAAQFALSQALRRQKALEKMAKRLRHQSDTSSTRIGKLMEGLSVENATLADYAAARGRVARQLERANAKLSEAIAMRENYQTATTDAIKAYGALTTATAKVIDGVEQALTAEDITTNLQDRLDKITKFRDNLRLLAAQGLSNAAYQQIVDMGVDGGSAYAEALLAGGLSAIQDTNSLVGQINSLAEQMGLDISNRLYQAGVDAARGLVDGLESLSAQLDKAATRLGNAIANAVKHALGIHSPSRVMMGITDNLGDTTVAGLDRQHVKVSRAAARFSDQIAVSPEVAAYAAEQGSTVSGNGSNNSDPRFRDLHVHTPSTDPRAVALETLNEVTGRL